MEESTSDDKKNTYIEGIFIQSEVLNKNKRIYKESATDKVVYKYIKEMVERKNAWGELDHPTTTTLNLQNASHRITKMWKEGTNWHAKAILINQGKGLIAKGLIEAGGTLGVSSRAMGKMRISEGVSYVEPIEIITAGDIVANPSAPDAFMESLMESKQWIYCEGKYIEQDIDTAKKSLRNNSSLENRIKIFDAFLTALKMKA
jgi:hypothetical protein